MTKRQTELIRLSSEVEAGDEGTEWRDRLDEWLSEKTAPIMEKVRELVKTPSGRYRWYDRMRPRCCFDGTPHVGRWVD